MAGGTPEKGSVRVRRVAPCLHMGRNFKKYLLNLLLSNVVLLPDVQGAEGRVVSLPHDLDVGHAWIGLRRRIQVLLEEF